MGTVVENKMALGQSLQCGGARAVELLLDALKKEVA